MKTKLQHGETGAALAVRIETGIGKIKIIGIDPDGALRIKANVGQSPRQIDVGVLRFLAELLHVPPNTIEIVIGAEQTKKLISITGITPGEVDELIAKHLK